MTGECGHLNAERLIDEQVSSDIDWSDCISSCEELSTCFAISFGNSGANFKCKRYSAYPTGVSMNEGSACWVRQYEVTGDGHMAYLGAGACESADFLDNDSLSGKDSLEVCILRCLNHQQCAFMSFEIGSFCILFDMDSCQLPSIPSPTRQSFQKVAYQSNFTQVLPVLKQRI